MLVKFFIGLAGFEDILYGYPLMEHHMERNFELTKNLDEYHVMVANNESVDVLFKTEPPLDKKWWLSEFYILRPAFGCCAFKTLVKIYFFRSLCMFLQDFDETMKKIIQKPLDIWLFLNAAWHKNAGIAP